jgi:hypothetical protein
MDQWKIILNMEMSLWLVGKAGIFLTTYITIGFSRITLLCGVNCTVHLNG